MDFRRSGQRRRRTLLEERDSAGAAPRRRPTAAPRVYAEAALDENQLRITDLIPRWDVTLWGLFLFGLACSAGWVALDHFSPAWAQSLQVSLAPLALSAVGGLASWWLASLYLVAGLKSLLIYQVRRYRNDDYRGSYRLWIWAAVTWLVASIDAVCNLRQLVAQLLAQTTQAPLLGEGAIWGEIAGALLFGPLALRLAIEVAACRPALVALVLATLGYTVAALANLPIHPWANDLYTSVVATSCVLASQQFLLLSLAYYARYVHLDAQGEIEHDEAEESDDSTATAASRDAEQAAEGAERPAIVAPPSIRANDLSAPSNPPRNDTLARLVGAHAASSDDEEDGEDEADSGSSGRKLSKAERKRLRRLGKAG